MARPPVVNDSAIARWASSTVTSARSGAAEAATPRLTGTQRGLQHAASSETICAGEAFNDWATGNKYLKGAGCSMPMRAPRRAALRTRWASIGNFGRRFGTHDEQCVQIVDVGQ